ncbi:hypothetical protein JKP88DRAFT_176987 [Tribonema minus]|uniref:ODAD1 central coiled coil region domain-containing protein n=1 Tax=Tribonema minus TaxID=303371 RepID=A0A835ZF99_9STRA|nr:hypothetical protein JKP88DRAFT_176987 [Tribonema minus]
MNTRERRQLADNISQLQAKADALTRGTILEQRRVGDLEQALKSATAEIATYRQRTKQAAVDVLNLHRSTSNPSHSRADGADPTKDADRNQKRLVGIMEARLNKLLVRHSEVVNGNSELREEICHMRKQRITTDDVRRQYETDIVDVRRNIASYLERAEQVTEERERIVKEKEELLSANGKEADEHDQHIDTVASYVAQQNTNLEHSIEEAARDAARNGPLPDVDQAGDLSLYEETQLKQQLVTLAQAERKEHDLTKSLGARLAWFNMASDELRRVSGISDLDQLIKSFMLQEANNFSLLNYIQSMGQEVDQGLDVAAALEQDIQRYEAEQETEEKQRNVIIRGLEEKVAAQLQARDEWAARMAAAAAISELVAKRVQSIFFKIQCDHYLQTLMKDSAGGGAGGARKGLDAMATMLSSQAITESNMLAYMSIIERRSVQIVTTYAQRLQATGLPVKFLSGPQRPPGWEVCIIPSGKPGITIAPKDEDIITIHAQRLRAFIVTHNI